jgi:Kef-type K+ transport system membrane component KefB
MTLLLVYAVMLVAAVLLSEYAQRSVLSNAVLFLIAGFLTGTGVLGLVAVQPQDRMVQELAEIALFSVLFTDGMRSGLRDLRRAWCLPGRSGCPSRSRSRHSSHTFSSASRGLRRFS